MLPAEAPPSRRDAQRPARALTLGAALGCAALLTALAGCGSDDDSQPADGAETKLTVILDVDGEGAKPPRRASTICAAATETSPCPQLAELTAADLAPVPPDQACTEIYGGPDVVTVTGTLHGEAVDATLTRANGCEVLRFGHVVALLEELFPDYDPGEALRP